MKRVLPFLPACAVAVSLLTGCEKQPVPEPYTEVDPNGFVNLSSPLTVAKFAPGETIPLVVSVPDPSAVDNITLYQVVYQRDSSIINTVQPNFSVDETARTTSQVINYTVPTNVTNKQRMRIDVTVNFKNGGSKVRRGVFLVANAPTLKFAATPATYRNGRSAANQSPNDIITYALVLNEGGINALPTTPSASPLFKTLDSITYFLQVPGQPERRIGKANLTTGAAATRNVDVQVPANATVGQQLTYRFVTYSVQQTASVSSTITVTEPARYTGTAKTGRISFGPGANADSLAFNLKTGANEPNANASTTKDLFLSANGNSLILNAGNTTRLFRLPAVENPTGFYNNATINDVARRYYIASGTTLLPAPGLTGGTPVTNIADLAAGDVILVRVRNSTANDYALLRVLGTRNGGVGGISRVRFEYRSL